MPWIPRHWEQGQDLPRGVLVEEAPIRTTPTVRDDSKVTVVRTIMCMTRKLPRKNALIVFRDNSGVLLLIAGTVVKLDASSLGYVFIALVQVETRMFSMS